MDVEEESRLIQYAKSGDMVALETLIGQHGDSLFRYICTFVGDQHHAEDVSQQVWVNAFEKLSQFDPAKGSLANWLFRIARNLALNHLRSKQRSPIKFGTPAPETQDVYQSSERAKHNEQFALLDLALAELPAHQRSAWTLSEIEGLTQSQVAEIEGVPEGTVKSRVSRAKTALKNILANHVEMER